MFFARGASGTGRLVDGRRCAPAASRWQVSRSVHSCRPRASQPHPAATAARRAGRSCSTSYGHHDDSRGKGRAAQSRRRVRRSRPCCRRCRPACRRRRRARATARSQPTSGWWCCRRARRSSPGSTLSTAMTRNSAPQTALRSGVEAKSPAEHECGERPDGGRVGQLGPRIGQIQLADEIDDAEHEAGDDADEQGARRAVGGMVAMMVGQRSHDHGRPRPISGR